MSVLHMESFSRFKQDFPLPYDAATFKNYVHGAMVLAGYYPNKYNTDAQNQNLSAYAMRFGQDAVNPQRSALIFNTAHQAVNYQPAVTKRIPRIGGVVVISGFSLYFPSTFPAVPTGVAPVMRFSMNPAATAASAIPSADVLFVICQDGSIRTQESSANNVQHPLRLVGGRLYYIEVRYDPATGDIRVWVDDTYVLNYVKVQANPTYLTVSTMDNAAASVGTGYEIQFSNWYILIDDGIAPTVRLGPTTRVVGSRPQSDASPNDFQRPSGFDSNAEVAAQDYNMVPQDYLRAVEAGDTDFYETEASADVANSQLVHAVAVRATMSNLDSGLHSGEALLRSGDVIATGDDIPYDFGCHPQFRHLLAPSNEVDFFESVHVVPGHGMFATSRTLGVWACGVDAHATSWVKVFNSGDGDFIPGRRADSAENGVTLLVPERVDYNTRPVSQLNKMLKFDPANGDITDPAAWSVLNLGIHENFEPADVCVCFSPNLFYVASSYILYHASDAAADTSAPHQGIWRSEDGGVTWEKVFRRFTTPNQNFGRVPYPNFVRTRTSWGTPAWQVPYGLRLAFMNGNGGSNEYSSILTCQSRASAWEVLPAAQSSSAGWIPSTPRFLMGSAWGFAQSPLLGFTGVDNYGPVVVAVGNNTSVQIPNSNIYLQAAAPSNASGPSPRIAIAKVITNGATGAPAWQVDSAAANVASWSVNAADFTNMELRVPAYDAPNYTSAEYKLDVYIPHTVAPDGRTHYIGFAPDLIMTFDGATTRTATFANSRKRFAQLYADDEFLPNNQPLPHRTLCDFKFAENGELVVVGRGIFSKATPGLPKYDTGLPQLSGFIQAESIIAKNPLNNAPWAPSDANAAEIGARITS